MALLLAALPAMLFAQESRLGNLIVSSIESRPTPPGSTVGVVYFSLRNVGLSGDRLVSLSSRIASAVELHETRTVAGVMQMREVSFVDIPAGATVIAKPGGLHGMLIGLTRPLSAGSSFVLSLQFRDAGTLTLKVPVI